LENMMDCGDKTCLIIIQKRNKIVVNKVFLLGRNKNGRS